jgi:hypothetical protein
MGNSIITRTTPKIAQAIGSSDSRVMSQNAVNNALIDTSATLKDEIDKSRPKIYNADISRWTFLRCNGSFSDLAYNYDATSKYHYVYAVNSAPINGKIKIYKMRADQNYSSQAISQTTNNLTGITDASDLSKTGWNIANSDTNFYLIHNGGNAIYTGNITNGNPETSVTRTPISTLPTFSKVRLACANGLFFAWDSYPQVSSNGKIYKSSDGVTWAQIADLSTNRANNFKFVQGNYYFCTESGLFVSSDGENFSNNTAFTGSSAYDVIFNESTNLYVACGFSSIKTSPDGTTWTQTATSTINRLFFNAVTGNYAGITNVSNSYNFREASNLSSWAQTSESLTMGTRFTSFNLSQTAVPLYMATINFPDNYGTSDDRLGVFYTNQTYANFKIPLRNLDIPTPPTSGTYYLKSGNGALSWGSS